MRILFYSGDTDGAVPTIGSLRWIRNLNSQYGYATIQPTQQWTLTGETANATQIAGYWTQYQSLLFVQVKGVGHLVPQWNRPGAWKIFYSFLNGVTLN